MATGGHALTSASPVHLVPVTKDHIQQSTPPLGSPVVSNDAPVPTSEVTPQNPSVYTNHIPKSTPPNITQSANDCSMLSPVPPISPSDTHVSSTGSITVHIPSATPSPVKNTTVESDPLLLEMEVEELSGKLQAVVNQQQIMGVTLQATQQTIKAILSRQNDILDHLSLLERQLQRFDYRRYSSNYPLDSSPTLPSWLDPELPLQLPADRFRHRRLTSTPDRNLPHHHFPPPHVPDSLGEFDPRSTQLANLSIGENMQHNPTVAAQPSGEVPPLPLPFRNSSSNALDSSEIANSKVTIIPVAAVLSKYPKLRCESKVATLAVKLAREAFFGDDILQRCTVSGERAYPGLPVDKVNELKTTIFQQFPQYWNTKHTFEPRWKSCVESVGQACKRLRSKPCKP